MRTFLGFKDGRGLNVPTVDKAEQAADKFGSTAGHYNRQILCGQGKKKINTAQQLKSRTRIPRLIKHKSHKNTVINI